MKDEQIRRTVELIFALSPSPRFPNHQADSGGANSGALSRSRNLALVLSDLP
jgi:hypothetical protein